MAEIIGLILGLIGAISAALYLWDRFFPIRRLSWKFAERAADKIKEQMTADAFSPTLIIGVGRGGAVMGALISACLGYRPLIVIDRKYIWKNRDRCDDILFRMDIPRIYLEGVLIVSGEVHTGNTMRIYSEYLIKLGAKSIRKATLYYEKGATIGVDYTGHEGTRKNLVMPWMISKQYVRADRDPPKRELLQDKESDEKYD